MSLLISGGQNSMTDRCTCWVDIPFLSIGRVVSKHLGVLRSQGLVGGRKQGNRTVYSIADPSLERICSVVCAAVGREARAEADALSPRGDVAPSTRDPGQPPHDRRPHAATEKDDARDFLAPAGVDVDAMAPLVDGKFMSAFVRATKPAA
jgi:hypothetical protein